MFVEIGKDDEFWEAWQESNTEYQLEEKDFRS